MPSTYLLYKFMCHISTVFDSCSNFSSARSVGRRTCRGLYACVRLGRCGQYAFRSCSIRGFAVTIRRRFPRWQRNACRRLKVIVLISWLMFRRLFWFLIWSLWLLDYTIRTFFHFLHYFCFLTCESLCIRVRVYTRMHNDSHDREQK